MGRHVRSYALAAFGAVVCGFAAGLNAQVIAPIARNGAIRISAGPLGPSAMQINHAFGTASDTHDVVSLFDPGSVAVASSSSDARIDAVATGASISIAISGHAARSAPPGGGGPATTSSSNFDQWTFTLSRASCVRLAGSVDVQSSAAITTQGLQLVGQQGSIILANGQHVAAISGMRSVVGASTYDVTATLTPGTYVLALFAYVDANGSPYAGSVNSSVSISICTADFNCDGAAGVQDIFDFLAAWFAGDPRADVNGSGINVQDIFDFLSAWFAGC